jgi:transketolase
MRDTMKTMLHEMAAEDPNLIAIIDDTGFQIFEEFERKFPKQFYNVGIAEQQFIGLAAGLALEGMHVILYNVCNFYIRAMEQIRVDLAYQQLGVVMVGVGGGLYYGTQGPTHHGTEDISLFRALPNMRVICPADPIEMRAAFYTSAHEQKPTYIRICKNNDPILHTKSVDIHIGQAIIMREGFDAAIIATGGMVREALKVAQMLSQYQIETRVVSMHTIKPIDTQMIVECAGFPALFTMEENSIIGGLGSSVAEVIAVNGSFPKCFHMFGFPDAFASVTGTRDYLNALFELDVESMAEIIRHTLLK